MAAIWLYLVFPLQDHKTTHNTKQHRHTQNITHTQKQYGCTLFLRSRTIKRHTTQNYTHTQKQYRCTLLLRSRTIKGHTTQNNTHTHTHTHTHKTKQHTQKQYRCTLLLRSRTMVTWKMGCTSVFLSPLSKRDRSCVTIDTRRRVSQELVGKPFLVTIITKIVPGGLYKNVPGVS